MKKILLIILILSCFITLTAQDLDYENGMVGSFLRMGLGARNKAMGNTGVAVLQSDAASFYNPATLPFLNSRSFNTGYSFLSLDRQHHYIGISTPLKPTAGLSISWIHAGVDDIEGRNSSGIPTQMYQTGEDAVMLSFANKFHPNFSFGMNLKYLRNSMVDLTATGIGFDIGLLYRIENKFAIGLQVKDIMSAYTWNTTDLFEAEGSNYKEKFPLLAKLGGAYQYKNILFCSDLEFRDNNEFIVHAGIEYVYSDLAFLRIGMNGSQFTCGAGLSYGFLWNMSTSLDYCFEVARAGEGNNHVFSWRFKL